MTGRTAITYPAPTNIPIWNALTPAYHGHRTTTAPSLEKVLRYTSIRTRRPHSLFRKENRSMEIARRIIGRPSRVTHKQRALAWALLTVKRTAVKWNSRNLRRLGLRYVNGTYTSSITTIALVNRNEKTNRYRPHYLTAASLFYHHRTYGLSLAKRKLAKSQAITRTRFMEEPIPLPPKERQQRTA